MGMSALHAVASSRRIDGETRIGIFATRDIKRGEDLTYDYQFVQFGADQDCYCGALGCRQKLGTKPRELKTSSSDSSLKPDAWEDFSNGQLDKENLPNKPSHQGGTYFRNCIGEFVRIWRTSEQRSFVGRIKHFDSSSREHTIICEDRRELTLDMSKEDWDFF